MEPKTLTRIVLAASGLVALGIGTAILVAPHSFYAPYGIALSGQTDLLNEIRASGGGLIGVGALILTGALVARHAMMAGFVAATLYLSYGASRIFAMSVDGAPDAGLVAIAGVELAIGAACAGVTILNARRAHAADAKHIQTPII